MVKNKQIIRLTTFALLFLGLWVVPVAADAATKYWIGPSGGNMSSNANWSTTSGGANDTTAPTSADLAVFSSGNSNSANIDASFGGSLAGLQIDAGYTGTVTLQRSLTLNASHFSQAGGTFSLGSNTLTIGTNASAASFTISGGTFNSGTGSLTFAGNGANAVDVSTSLMLYNLTVNKGAGVMSVATGDTLIVTNNLTISSTGNGMNGPGTIEMRGNTTTVTNTGVSGGSLVIQYLVSGDQSISSTNGVLPGILVNKASGTVTQVGTLTLNGGSFNLQSGTYTLGSSTLNIGNSATTCNFTVSGGTFDSGTGTLALTGLGSITVDVVTSQIINNFTINKAAGTTTFSSGDTIIVTNNLTIAGSGNGINGPGAIEMRGSTTTVTNTGGVTGNVQIQYLVTGDQVINSTSGIIPGIFVNKTSGTITQSGSLTIGPGNFTLQSGTYAVGSNTLTIGPNTASAVNFTVSGGTFDAGTSTLVVAGNGSNSIDVATTQTLYIFQVNKPVGTLTIASGDTLVISAGLLLTDGVVNGGTLSAQGDVTIGAAANGGTTSLQFTGTSTQNFTDNGGTKTSGNIAVNKNSGEVKLLTAMSYNNSGQTLTLTTGTMNLNGFALTVNSALTVGSSGTLKFFGNETVTRGSLTLSTGSTVLYTGNGNSASTSYTLTTLATSYYNLMINSSDGATDSFAISATPFTVAGDFTLISGTVTGGTATINVAGDWSNSGTFTANTSTVNFNGTSQAIIGSTTFYNFTKNVTSADTLTFTNGTTQIISNTWNVQGASGQLLSLRSDSNGSQWSINPQGTRTLGYLDVKDSNNINATAVSVAGLNVTNSGNNTNWAFMSVTSVTGQNPQTTGGGKSITINGLYFVDAPTITIGGTSATSVVFVSATEVTAVAPAKAAGSYDVVVTNPDSSVSTCADCMTYVAPPTVTSIDQTYAKTAGGQSRTITGSGMKVGTSGIVIDPSGTADAVTTTNTSSSVIFTTPAHAAGSVVVRVYGTGGTDNNGIYTDTASGFIVFEAAPTFTAIDEEYAPTVGSGTRTVTGTGIKVGASGAKVGSTTVTTSGLSTSVTFTPPDAAAGAVTIRLYSTNGTDDNGIYVDATDVLTYVARPTVTSIDQTYAKTSGGQTRTITGSGMKVGASGIVIDPSGTADVVTTTNTSSSVVFTTPAHAAGSVVVRVYGAVGTDSNGIYTDTVSGFMVFEAAPTFTAIDEEYAPTVGSAARTITGSGLKVGVDGAKVGSTLVTTSGLATSVTFTPPNAAAGAVTIRLYSTNGTDDNGIYVDVTDSIIYEPKPTVVTVSPSTGLDTAGGDSVTISGSGIKVGANGAVVDPGGTANVVTTTGVSTAALFTTPAHAAGAVTLRVYSPNGTNSNGIYTDYSNITFAVAVTPDPDPAPSSSGGVVLPCALDLKPERYMATMRTVSSAVPRVVIVSFNYPLDEIRAIALSNTGLFVDSDYQSASSNRRWMRATAAGPVYVQFLDVCGRRVLRVLSDNDSKTPTIISAPAVKNTVSGSEIFAVSSVARNLATERNAINAFRFAFKRKPSSGIDWSAVNYLAYGGEVMVRDVAKERAGMTKYRRLYSATPSNGYQWRLLHIISYVP